MDSGKSEPESILCWFPNLGSHSLGTLTLKIPFSARTGHVGSPATFLGTQTDFFRGSPTWSSLKTGIPKLPGVMAIWAGKTITSYYRKVLLQSHYLPL
jgi:hypothetical protein